eukprot:1160936-Pelagomonas_calceolata.AAC.3
MPTSMHNKAALTPPQEPATRDGSAVADTASGKVDSLPAIIQMPEEAFEQSNLGACTQSKPHDFLTMVISNIRPCSSAHAWL